MGMFDDITYTAPCPICGEPLNGWQSKSAGCNLDKLTPAELWQQREDDETATTPDCVDFYQDCGKCGTWVEINLGPGLLNLTEDDYRRMRSGEYPERRRGPIIPGGDAL